VKAAVATRRRGKSRRKRWEYDSVSLVLQGGAASALEVVQHNIDVCDGRVAVTGLEHQKSSAVRMNIDVDDRTTVKDVLFLEQQAWSRKA
jgi:hypothetical protein